MTFLLYLNDDYDGGRTEFVTLGIAHKGRCGEGLFFVNALANGAPDRRTLHAGRPPTRGEKWVVSQFIRNRADLLSRGARREAGRRHGRRCQPRSVWRRTAVPLGTVAPSTLQSTVVVRVTY